MRTVLGRRPHPAALALTLASLFVAVTYLTGAASVLTDSRVTLLVGLVAAVGAGVKIAAWARASERLLRAGLLVSVFVWIFVVAAACWHGLYTSALLGTGWVVLASGTYWLEAADPGGRRG